MPEAFDLDLIVNLINSQHREVQDALHKKILQMQLELIRKNERINELEKMATCGGGMLGCNGGPDCTSDHK